MSAPRIGDIVHYRSYGTPGGEFQPLCRAAVVTAVRDHEPVPEHGMAYADLAVLNPTGMFFNQNVAYDHTGAEIPERSYADGTWHWPEA